MNDEDKNRIATLSSDLCTIRYEDQTDRFVRAVLHQKLHDGCQTLDYGVWVSLSEDSYDDYVGNYDNESHEATYFGFLSNNLTGYKDTISVKTNVVLRGKLRPEVIHHKDQMNNDFVRDYYEGIDRRVAEERVSQVLGK